MYYPKLSKKMPYGQVIHVNYGSWTVTYEFDANGNRTSKIVSQSTSLPVQGLLLTAKTDPSGRQASILEWSTLSEYNNAYFEVQYSTNATDFESITQLDSRGNTNTKQSYNFVHENPINGINYYRIRQVDIDGVSSFSNKVAVKFANTNLKATIFPNPNQGIFEIKIDDSSKGKNTSIILQDIIGKKVSTITSKKDDTIWIIDASSLPSGTYIIHISNELGILRKTIVITH